MATGESGLEPGVPDDLSDRLTAYYDEEARLGARTDVGPLRAALRVSFARLVVGEGRTSVLDVGAGPGRDATAFVTDGLLAVGADLSIENCRRMRAAGIPAVAASLWELPFRPGAFDAVWSMSTLVHVPDDRLDDALASILAAARPGAPVGLGTWGGFDAEGISAFTRIDPPRFFSLRTHDRMRATLERHASIDHWETFHPDPASGWEYQFAIVRRRPT